MAILVSTAVLVVVYGGLVLLIGGTDSPALDAMPFWSFVAGALLLSSIVFWPDGDGPASASSDPVQRQPELLAFVAFARGMHERADNPHRTREGSEALAARLREKMEVAANHPVRLVWPEQWVDAPVDIMRPGVGEALRRRATAALSRGGAPKALVDRLRADGDGWRFFRIGDVTALACIHTESGVELGERFVLSTPAADMVPEGRLILAFLIPKPGALAIPAGTEPELERIVETKLRDVLGVPDAALGLVFPDKWTGGPLGGTDEVLGDLSRIELAAPIAAAIEESGYDSGTAAWFLAPETEWDCRDLAEIGHLLLFGVTTGTRPGTQQASEPAATAVVGFVVHPEDSLAAGAETVDDLRPGALEDRLARELSLPGAPVTVYRAGDWDPPPVATATDIYRDEILRGIVRAAVERVRTDGMDADLARGALGDGSFETLVLPTSGRVVLFRAISGPALALGRLV